MTPEGFYRVIWDGHPGVGYCRHHDSTSRGEKYETWDLLFLRDTPGEKSRPATSYTNSTDPNIVDLQIGKRIRGLP